MPINDWLSFMRFPGLSLLDRVPDARTIRLFRERLTKAKPRDDGSMPAMDLAIPAFGYSEHASHAGGMVRRAAPYPSIGGSG